MRSSPTLRRWAIGICCAVGVCILLNWPVSSLAPRHATRIRVAVIHSMWEQASREAELEVCFVGQGTTFSPSSPLEALDDPDPTFLAHFKALGIPVLPASSHTTQAPEDGTLGFIVQDVSGRRGAVLASGDIRQFTRMVVACRSFYCLGGMAAGAYKVYLVRLFGIAIPVRVVREWSA